MICEESSHQRISFASDLGQSDGAPLGSVRRDTRLLDSSNSDFEFHISRNFDPGDSSPADEIFEDGMILPVLPFQVTAASTMRKRLYKYELPPIVSAPSLPSSSSFPPPPPLPIVSTPFLSSSSSSSFTPPPLPMPFQLPRNSRKYSENETQRSGNGQGRSANLDSEAEKSSKSFWSFKRSSSLNCDLKKSLIRSFPCLKKSNSTGSKEILRDIHKHSSLRHGVPLPEANMSSSYPSSFSSSSYQFRPQKPENNRDGGGGGSYGIAPVMGGLGPSPFDFGSILQFSKEKKK